MKSTTDMQVHTCLKVRWRADPLIMGAPDGGSRGALAAEMWGGLRTGTHEPLGHREPRAPQRSTHTRREVITCVSETSEEEREEEEEEEQEQKQEQEQEEI